MAAAKHSIVTWLQKPMKATVGQNWPVWLWHDQYVKHWKKRTVYTAHFSKFTFVVTPPGSFV